MERDDQQIKGWRKYKHAFIFGRPNTSPPKESEQIEQQPYDHISLDEGCSRYVCNFDSWISNERAHTWQAMDGDSRPIHE